MSRKGSKKFLDPYERENEKIMKLFNDASSAELSSHSDSEQPETSSESEKEDSEEDPYNDCDGDYGSDINYVPDVDSGSSTTHVSDSEEDGDNVKRKRVRHEQVLSVDTPTTLSVHVHVPASVDSLVNLTAVSSRASTQNIQNSQVPSVESPITLKDLGVHIHVPATTESVSTSASPQNAQNYAIQSEIHLNNLRSYDSDTTPPRSIESMSLLQEMDSENDESNSQSANGQQQPILPPILNAENTDQQPLSALSTLDAPTAHNNQRPMSPPIIDEEWQTSTAPITEFEFDDSTVGPQFSINANISSIDIFNRFFPPTVIEQLVERTNFYGAALCNVNRPHTRGSRKKSFKPTTVEEMQRFLGLCILQSHVETPNIRKLFTFTDPLYYHPIFTYSMTGRRFEQLLRCLCVYEGNAKGINKVLGFANQMIAIFQSLYKPQRQLSLDESMMLFRGRLSFRQYIKSKKAKYGVKFYILTTSDGYILNFKIYQGKNNDTDDMDTDTLLKSKTEKLVMNLMQPYLYKGHEVYMDNYYNSVALSNKLLSCRTHTTGTLRKDRKDNPKDIVTKVLKKDEHVWKRKGKVYVSAWKDKRNVTMITTQHHPRLIVTTNRFGKLLRKPKEVAEYNKFMSGIDISDQMLSYYSTPKKTVRWYKKVFFHIFDMAIWNAYYTFKKHCNNRATMLGFREQIIKYYLGISQLSCADIISYKKISDPRIYKPNQGNSQENTTSEPSNIHWPELIPKTENCKRNKVFLKCRMCTKNKIKKETSYRCKGCPFNPPLCPGCFEQWHSQTDNID